VTGQLVSAYAASRLLERDRQTIERAVRGLTPDTFQKGKPRWRLARIVERLNERAARNRTSDAMSHNLERRFAELEQRYDAVRAAPTLDERRALARTSFFPFLAEVESEMHADARRSGEDPSVTALRVAEHTRLNVFTLRDVLGWTHEQAWAEFMKADPRVCDGD
jgi:hypothetical protein